MGSKERREREKLATRQRILDAARELFVENGYDAVTMRKIAEQIEYSPTAIYLHFEDKEALMTELSLCDFEAFAAQFRRVPLNVDPVARLHGFGEALIGFAVENPNQYRLLFMTQRPEPNEAAMARKPQEDAYHLMIHAVMAAQKQGCLHPSWDVDLIAQTLWGSMHGLVALHLVMPKKGRITLRPLEEVTHTAMHLLMAGFQSPRPDLESAES